MAGVGFQPDVVFHAHGGHSLTAALPANIADGAFGLGVMDFDGDQWAFANWLEDAVGTSDTQRGQVTNAALYSFNQLQAVQKQASLGLDECRRFHAELHQHRQRRRRARVLARAQGRERQARQLPEVDRRGAGAAAHHRRRLQAEPGHAGECPEHDISDSCSAQPVRAGCVGRDHRGQLGVLRIRMARARRSSTPSTRPAKCS